jgi:tRNA(fMet)-specific endonuclease VapC
VTFLDTSVIIDFLAGDKKIITLVEEIAKKEEVKTTTITEYELLKHKTKLRKNIAEKFLASVSVYSFDSAAAKESAFFYNKLKEAGKIINENDLLIAGISHANDEVLLTRDQKFSNFEDQNIKIV